PLIRLLRRAGHSVTGTTRTPGKVSALEALGANAVVVDALDGAARKAAVAAARPEVVIHQLTDLPDAIDPQTYPAALARNSRIRIEGTPNLVAAAIAAGAK